MIQVYVYIYIYIFGLWLPPRHHFQVHFLGLIIKVVGDSMACSNGCAWFLVWTGQNRSFLFAENPLAQMYTLSILPVE